MESPLEVGAAEAVLEDCSWEKAGCCERDWLSSCSFAPAVWKYSTGFPPKKVPGVRSWWLSRLVNWSADGDVRMTSSAMIHERLVLGFCYVIYMLCDNDN